MGAPLGFGIGDALMTGMSYLDRGHEREQNRLEQEKRDQLRAEVQQMIAKVNAGSRENVATTQAGARRYASDMSYDAADRRSGATEYAADQSNEGRHYAADMGYDAADRRAGATEYASENALTGARARVAGQRYAADKGAESRHYAADTSAGARDRAGARSLYGTLFRPRTTPQYDERGNPVPQAAAPKFTDWMRQSGITPQAPDDQDDEDDPMADGTDDDQDDADADAAVAPPPSAASRPAPAGAAAGTSPPPAGGKIVSRADLTRFAAATKRTPQQAEEYAKTHGWTIQ